MTKYLDLCGTVPELLKPVRMFSIEYPTTEHNLPAEYRVVLIDGVRYVLHHSAIVRLRDYWQKGHSKLKINRLEKLWFAVSVSGPAAVAARAELSGDVTTEYLVDKRCERSYPFRSDPTLNCRCLPIVNKKEGTKVTKGKKLNKFYVGRTGVTNTTWAKGTLDEAIEHAKKLCAETGNDQVVVKVIRVVRQVPTPIAVEIV